MSYLKQYVSPLFCLFPGAKCLQMLALLVVMAPVAVAMEEDDFVIYDEEEVNGHAGYLTAWAVKEPMDKVVLIAAGFDVKNSKHPIEELTGDFAPVVALMTALGWSVVFFDYVDGATDLKENADNLAVFIRHLDTVAEEDYHLAVIGGSMGGIVARTMFVQENEDMGVETYVSIDSPHWGVYLSRWVDDTAADIVDFPAARQMYNGHEDYEEHYGWLQAVESTLFFKKTVNRPMATCAIALSDASEGYWRVDNATELIHNKYYPVASYINLQGLRSTYMPYHSTAYLRSDETKDKHRTGFSKYRYKKLDSNYFDTIIPNARDEHAAPPYAVKQALRCVLDNAPQGAD